MAYKTGFMVLRKFRHDSKLDFTFRNPNRPPNHMHKKIW